MGWSGNEARWIRFLFSPSQPVCDQHYDDSFEDLDLDIEGWRSELELQSPTMYNDIIVL